MPPCCMDSLPEPHVMAPGHLGLAGNSQREARAGDQPGLDSLSLMKAQGIRKQHASEHVGIDSQTQLDCSPRRN